MKTDLDLALNAPSRFCDEAKASPPIGPMEIGDPMDTQKRSGNSGVLGLPRGGGLV